APGPVPEGVRGPGVPARFGRPGGFRRGTAGTGVGRGGRPVHDRGEDDDPQAAGQAWRPTGHPHRPRGRLPDRRGVMFICREVAALLRLRPTLRTQLTLLYGGLLAALGGALLFLLVPLQGTASVQDGPHAAAVQAALNAAVRDKEIIGAIALPV